MVLTSSLVPTSLADDVKSFTVSFQDQKVVYANSSITKVYDLGKVLGNATIEWVGKGSGNAYVDEDGITKETLDLSTNGSVTVELSGGDSVIRLDNNALWHGTITVLVQDTYRISVSLSRTSLSLRPGGSTSFTMTITRTSGLDRYVTLQYSAPSALSITVSPQPPYNVGSERVTVTVRASSNAYGTYHANLYIYAHDTPTSVDPEPPSIPPVMVPWGHTPNVPHYWVMAGELNLSIMQSGGLSDLSSVTNAANGSTFTIVAVMLLAIIVVTVVLFARGRKRRW